MKFNKERENKRLLRWAPFTHTGERGREREREGNLKRAGA